MPTTRQVTFDLQEELYWAVRAICKDHNQGKILHHEKLLKTHCYNEGIRDWVEKKKKEKGGNKVKRWEMIDDSDKCPKCGGSILSLVDDEYVYAEKCSEGCYQKTFKQ